MKERTVENLTTATNVFSEVAYLYFEVLQREGSGDMQVMTKVDDTDVLVQMDRINAKLKVTVPDLNWISPEDELDRIEFPMKALIQVATIHFKKGIADDRGNGATVVVDDFRYNVWLDEKSGHIRFNMDAQDRRRLED